jgi:hypothetical protein
MSFITHILAIIAGFILGMLFYKKNQKKAEELLAKVNSEKDELLLKLDKLTTK